MVAKRSGKRGKGFLARAPGGGSGGGYLAKHNLRNSPKSGRFEKAKGVGAAFLKGGLVGVALHKSGAGKRIGRGAKRAWAKHGDTVKRTAVRAGILGGAVLAPFPTALAMGALAVSGRRHTGGFRGSARMALVASRSRKGKGRRR